MNTIYESGKRFLLGHDLSAQMAVYKTKVFETDLEQPDGSIKFDVMVDAHVKLQLSETSRPIILHKNSTHSDYWRALHDYKLKVAKVRDMFEGVMTHISSTPDKSAIIRDFLNPARIDEPLAGGTLLIKYDATCKTVTVDLADCYTKFRNAYLVKEYCDLVTQLMDFFNEALEDLDNVDLALIEYEGKKD